MPRPVSELRQTPLREGIAVGQLDDYPNDNTKFLRGDGVWAAPAEQTVRYRKTTENDVVNTTTETDLLNGEITVAAGVMSTDKLLRATLVGDYFNNSGAARTLRLKVKLGGTTIFDDASGANPAVAVRWPFRVEFVIGNLGAANSQFTEGTFLLGQPVAGTTGIGDLANIGAAAAIYVIAPFVSNGTTAVDTSAACLLEVTATHGAADANLSARLKYALVEIV